MKKSKISDDLLFTQRHFDLLARLYKSSLDDYGSVADIHKAITETVAFGLDLARVSYWKILSNKLVCQTLFDASVAKHTTDKDLLASELPVYFNALKEGIAIVANDARTNEFTKELTDVYLIPRGISDMLDLPIREDGQLVGVLCCERCGVSQRWSEADLAFARAAADMMMLLLEQNRHRETQRETERLYNISKRLNEKLLDYTYIISHNIRSNTSNMSMLMDLIDDTEQYDEKLEYLKLLRDSSNKLSETIHYLNETISIQLDSKERTVRLNLKSALEKTLLGVNGIIKKEHATINISVPPEMTLKTIPSYFESIMFNLLTNAIKYRSPDRAPQIDISAKKIKGKTEILVKDNGLGIDMVRNRNKIFGMYKTFHAHPDAVGLGLFMSKNHVDALGGSIEVDSTPGKGTTFKVVL
ncbi:sensor histidine kinase [Flavobacterium caeni]|uniref:histidine kinase n=1 Tax=Flavobacterium caeni TaxID=490189 RepID=A0A1G5IWX4_9FLAO|nr:GAF domain-containing sensor histidine kinase [Flavobacterium caeni]SCY80129.1 Signal transduction histidine kinase [Flavobacterium caeni]